MKYIIGMKIMHIVTGKLGTIRMIYSQMGGVGPFPTQQRLSVEWETGGTSDIWSRHIRRI